MNKDPNKNKTRKNNMNTKNIKTLLHKKEESLLEYLSSGSYGSIYRIPSTTKEIVMKEHTITDFLFNQHNTCSSWKNEYNIHKDIYTRVTPLLHQYISIVKPYMFGYGTRKNKEFQIININMNTNTKNKPDNISCFIVMDRILSYTEKDKIPNKMIEILKKPFKFKQEIPFYMFLSSVENDTNKYITLPMLKGTTLHEFPKDTLNYCDVEEKTLTYSLLQEMMNSFFLIIDKGYIPRDIEYVLNGGDDNAIITILDFNEVKSIEKRRELVEDYNIEEDIANVYIDLSNLRKEKNERVNPQAPYEVGTPQWKFLPNPLTAPQTFLSLARKLISHEKKYNIEKVFEYILYYSIKKIKNINKNIELKTLYFSQETDPEVFKVFDITFQNYIVNSLLDVCVKRKIENPLSNTDITFDTSVSILQKVLKPKQIEIDYWDVF
jgi:hypothetical protein